MVIQYFTLLATIAMSTLCNTYYPLVKWTHWLRTEMAKLQCTNKIVRVDYLCSTWQLPMAGWILSRKNDLLTKYKYNTNCYKDSHGFTPLRYAASNNHLEVVRYFVIEQHCNPMTRDKNGDTILHIACNNSHVHIVQYLLSTGKVNPMAKNKNGETPMYKVDNTNRLPLLHAAAHHGWMDTVIDLIAKYKCDTNCKDSDGHTPLHYAARNNHLEVVRYFINEQHCDPMTRDNDGDTPLHYACDHSHTKIVQYLLSTGKVNPLVKNKNGETPLYNARL